MRRPLRPSGSRHTSRRAPRRARGRAAPRAERGRLVDASSATSAATAASSACRRRRPRDEPRAEGGDRVARHPLAPPRRRPVAAPCRLRSGRASGRSWPRAASALAARARRGRRGGRDAQHAARRRCRRPSRPASRRPPRSRDVARSRWRSMAGELAVQVVLADEDDGQVPDGGEVQRLVEGSPGWWRRRRRTPTATRRVPRRFSAAPRRWRSGCRRRRCRWRRAAEPASVDVHRAALPPQ